MISKADIKILYHLETAKFLMNMADGMTIADLGPKAKQKDVGKAKTELFKLASAHNNLARNIRIKQLAQWEKRHAAAKVPVSGV